MVFTRKGGDFHGRLLLVYNRRIIGGKSKSRILRTYISGSLRVDRFMDPSGVAVLCYDCTLGPVGVGDPLPLGCPGTEVGIKV